MNTITKAASNGTATQTLIQAAEATSDDFPGDEANWRHAVMQDALRCRERDGSPEYCILRALQSLLPAWATRMFYENTIHTEEALRHLLPDLTACLSTALHGNNDEDSPVTPVFGWWRGTYPPSSRWKRPESGPRRASQNR